MYLWGNANESKSSESQIIINFLIIHILIYTHHHFWFYPSYLILIFKTGCFTHSRRNKTNQMIFQNLKIYSTLKRLLYFSHVSVALTLLIIVCKPWGTCYLCCDRYTRCTTFSVLANICFHTSLLQWQACWSVIALEDIRELLI